MSNTQRPLRVRFLAALIIVVLAPFMIRTWERWNQPRKAEMALVFAGLALWGWVFWTVVSAL